MEYNPLEPVLEVGVDISGQKGFNDLPGELRSQIYDFVIPEIHLPRQVDFYVKVPRGQNRSLDCAGYKAKIDGKRDWGVPLSLQVHDALSLMRVGPLVREEIARRLYSNLTFSFAATEQFIEIADRFTPYTASLIHSITYLPSPQPSYPYISSLSKVLVQTERLFSALEWWTGLDLLTIAQCRKYYDVDDGLPWPALPQRDFIWHPDTLNLVKKVQTSSQKLKYCYYDNLVRFVTITFSSTRRRGMFDNVFEVDVEYRNLEAFKKWKGSRDLGNSSSREIQLPANVTFDFWGIPFPQIQTMAYDHLYHAEQTYAYARRYGCPCRCHESEAHTLLTVPNSRFSAHRGPRCCRRATNVTYYLAAGGATTSGRGIGILTSEICPFDDPSQFPCNYYRA